MQDHGSDVATIVASASVDAGKEVAIVIKEVTAAVLVRLMLLKKQISPTKFGETNIDKLIKSLDEGDQIVSAVIDPLRADQIARLSKKHGVVYAMVENQQGQMIVYFKQSEAERMQHIMEEILRDDVKEQPASDEKAAGSSQPQSEEKKSAKETEEAKSQKGRNASNDVPMQQEPKEPLKNHTREQIFENAMESAERTTVLFNRDNPMDFVEIFSDSEGITQFSIHRGGELQHNDGLPDQKEAEQEAASYEQYGSFQIQGASYKEKELLNLVRQVADQQKLQLQQQKEAAKKAGLLNEVMQQPAWIDSNLHIIADSENKDNFIAIYKELETTEKGIETRNTVKVYENGIEKNQADPTSTLAGYQAFDHTQRTGKSARGQFEKLQADSERGLKQQQKEQAEQKLMAQSEKKMPLETHVMFDAGKSDRFIELRQNENTVDAFLHDGASVQQISNVQAAKEVAAYDQPMTIVAKGHYDHESLFQKVDGIAQQQAAKQQSIADAAAKVQKIDAVMNSAADLDGTLHTFIDTKNTNNRIYVYKDIQPVDGELRTVNKSLVFQNGKKIELSPTDALKQMEKYRHSEKSGKAAGAQFEKLMQADGMIWSKKEKAVEREDKAEGHSDRKTLAQYEKDVEKIKATRIPSAVPGEKLGIGAKDASVRGER